MCFNFRIDVFVFSLRRHGCHHLLCARRNLRKVLPRLRRVRVPPIRTLRVTQFTGATVATLSTPGVEPGLSRPQRDVLTTRRCGRYECAHKHHIMLRYEIAITNTPVAADSEILESFTIEPHTTADPLLTKSYVLIRVAKCMFGGCSRAPGNNTMYYYRLHGCIFGGCKMYCYGLHPTLGVVLLAVVICINTRCKCIFIVTNCITIGCIGVFVWTLAIFKRKSKRESEREREKEKAFYMASFRDAGSCRMYGSRASVKSACATLAAHRLRCVSLRRLATESFTEHILAKSRSCQQLPTEHGR